MLKKITTSLIAIFIPLVAAFGQNNAAAADGTTGATTVDGTTEATAQNADAKQSLSDESTTVISLLTCTPGDEIHRLYGHTALRTIEREDGGDGKWNYKSDWAVNFGWFSFNTPNFLMKFILGLTDYSMANQTMGIFIEDLLRDNMAVREQVLNLTPEEAAHVKKACNDILSAEGFENHEYRFENNPLPERIQAANWTYRYNFLYDNCTTRAIDIVKEALKANGETLVYSGLEEKITTQREMIHEFTKDSPWYEFGQDLLLGPEVDEKHTMQELTDSINFLPTYAENFFEHAQIKGKDGQLRPLVSDSHSLTPFFQPQPHKPAVPFGPIPVAGVILALALVVTMGQRKARDEKAQRAWRIWGNALDFTMMAVQGAVGILLVIMVGWSEHPAVGTNWLLLLFNPLFFLGIPARLWWKKLERCYCWFACLMALGVILVGAFGLQHIPYALYPYAIAVALRAKK